MANSRDEWHIGLFKNVTTAEWTWINGKLLTIHKWQQHEPDKNDMYALIAKEWPRGSYGLLSSNKGTVPRGWICEEETGLNLWYCTSGLKVLSLHSVCLSFCFYAVCHFFRCL